MKIKHQSNAKYIPLKTYRKKKEFKFLYKKDQQSLFIKIRRLIVFNLLEIIFPSNHKKIKKKLKSFVYIWRIKIIGSNLPLFKFLFLKIESLYLRLMYIKYYKVPYNHIHSLYILKKFLKISKVHNIKYFLTSGSLLGVARGQQCIAGGASDVDIGVTFENVKKLYLLEKELKKKGLIEIKQWPNNKKSKLDYMSFIFYKSHIDVQVYWKIKKNSKQMWVGDRQKSKYINHTRGVFLKSNYFSKLKKVKFYDLFFYSPRKPKEYLDQKYGKDWKKLDYKNHNFFLGLNKLI
jgi:phosphorylcholine metabolism protein LicD|tara:strand:+ start:489 stop:1361 length:873 start_codon:yes stop_codon:yes gene_type:complete